MFNKLMTTTTNSVLENESNDVESPPSPVQICNTDSDKLIINSEMTSLKETIISEEYSSCMDNTKSLKFDNELISCNEDISMNDKNEFNSEDIEIPGSDPAEWKINKFIIDYICKNGYHQNLDLNFSRSKRLYQTVRRGSTRTTYRYLNKSLFETVLVNGEKCPRSYLVYSQSKGAVFCIPCYLFHNPSEFPINGFSDWKRPKSVNKHENSLAHKTYIIKMKNRVSEMNRIDKNLDHQLETEKEYWKNVLRRVCAVVKSLSSHGLPFRGDDEKFDSLYNGNFMMCIELIAEFDPFLANHLSSYSNPGKGHVSYLSHTIYEQFIKLMTEKVQNQIVEEVRNARYFSISIDSTSDISHIDQLSFKLRYVNSEGLPVERFLCFLENVGHKSQHMAETVFSILKEHKIDISYLRGQAYDNAKSMSGIYSGLQARIKDIAPLADFVLCSAHSLNLVGSCAASCCKEANTFFNFVQNVYTFFSALTHRWELLKVSSTLKNLSVTRWSARDDACRSLNINWNIIQQTLVDISSNLNEKSNTPNEACGLLRLMNHLETTFMILFWGDVLQRFNVVSKYLQSINIDICTVCEQYDVLIKYFSNLRNDDMFQQYQGKAIQKSVTKEYETTFKRKKKKKKTENYENTFENEITLTGGLEFKVNTYYVICDNIIEELRNRKLAYDNIIAKYSFFLNLSKMNVSEIRNAAENLYLIYKTDLDKTFINECVHFKSYIDTLNDPPKTIVAMNILMKKDKLENIYPYVSIALRMFLCTPATNCTAERSFSTLRRVKTYLRSNISGERLNSLAILNIESQLTMLMKYDEIIDKFAAIQARKKL